MSVNNARIVDRMDLVLNDEIFELNERIYALETLQSRLYDLVSHGEASREGYEVHPELLSFLHLIPSFNDAIDTTTGLFYDEEKERQFNENNPPAYEEDEDEYGEEEEEYRAGEREKDGPPSARAAHSRRDNTKRHQND